MLDENLPTFFLKPTDKASKDRESFLFTQNGSDPEAYYQLTHVDAASPAARNTYAAALYDAHNPEVLFGEVLAQPGWSHPTLSQDEIRRNGGVVPPPQPVFPDQFAIQLYNPDTQIVVQQQTTKWSGSVSWEFSLPQVSFRMPSASALDRTQTDPGAHALTPRVNLTWRKEGRYGKDMTCYLTGKSTDPTGKKAKKNKEPDIAVALFSGLREMTIMEPNLYRIEIEDYKGLEVVLLLSAAVIRDMFFANPRETFHIADPVSGKPGGLRARKGSSPLEGPGFTPPVMTPQPPPPPAYTGPSQYPPEKVATPTPAPAPAPAQHTRHAQTRPPPSASTIAAAKRSSLPPLQTQPQQPPRIDPHKQREIDAETARLKVQIEAEEREAQRQEEAARKARRRQEAEQERQTRQFLENERKQKEREEKERRRKQAEVDAETERLRKQFGDQSSLLTPQPQQQQRPAQQQRPVQAQRLSWQTPRPAQPPRPQQRPGPVPTQPVFAAGPYLQPGTHRPTASHSSFFGGQPKPASKPTSQPQGLMKAKKSFWGLRTSSETNAEKLKKKKSSMF